MERTEGRNGKKRREKRKGEEKGGKELILSKVNTQIAPQTPKIL